jgi:protein-S-isoprenylcysteine O-methyltransferase Ste14
MVNLKQLILQVGGMFAVFAAVLFIAGGTIAWPAGWIFLALFFGFVVALTGWLLRHNPELLIERMNGIGKADQKSWDKVFFALMQIIFIAWLILIPLDAVRYRWSQMPATLQTAGAVLMLISFWLLFLTFRANSYLSPAVRIQKERGQSVISTGPYHYVRHPMYISALLMLIGMSMLLGSWYGLVLTAILALAIAFRAVNEERVLREELGGYRDYAEQVRYRFIPYVW